MGHCEDCQHWTPTQPWEAQEGQTVGSCEAVQPERLNGHWCKGYLAVVVGESIYNAELLTDAKFGCVLFKRTA